MREDRIVNRVLSQSKPFASLFLSFFFFANGHHVEND